MEEKVVEDTAIPSDLLVLKSLVESLSQRLPFNSGQQLSQLEGDDFFVKNTRAVIELCPWRLWDVVGALSGVLTTTIKQQLLQQPQQQLSKRDFAAVEDEDPSIAPKLPSVQLLHSQLFVLRLMANCLAYYWNLFRNTKKEQRDLLDDDDDDSFTEQHQMPQTIDPRVLADPPALNETLANYLLNICTHLFLTYMSEINANTITHPDFLRSLGFVDDREVSPTPAKIASFFTQTKSGHYMPSPAMFHTPTGPEIFLELQKEAGKIVFYLSASNWNLVLGRIRQKVYSLTNSTTANADDGLSSAVDLAELRFMEYLNVDLTRLPSLLIEMNQCFKFLPKRVQYLSAIGIRKSIWNWIDTHPQEVIDVHHNQRRVEGSPESFFITLNNLGDGTSRRRVLFWPTQMMLLALCPDLFVNVLLTGLGTPQKHTSNPYERLLTRVNPDLGRKAESWLENVRKQLRGRLADVSIFCQVDLLKLISVLAKPGQGPVSDYFRSMVATVDFDMRDKLFSRLETRPTGSQGQILIPDGITLDYRVLTEALSAILKLNPFHSLRALVGGFFSGNAPGVYRVILIRACYELVCEDDMSGVNSSLAGPLRTLFVAQENVLKNAEAVLGMEAESKAGKSGLFAGKTAKKERAITMQAMNDLTAENFDLIYGTLKVWAKSPALVVVHDNSILPLDELRSILDTIVRQTNNEDPYIRSKAGETLRAVFATDFVSVWDGSSANWRFPSGRPTNFSMEIYWNISSSVLQTIAIQLLGIRFDTTKPDTIALEHPPILKELLDLLRDLLKARTEFLRKHKEDFACRIDSTAEERVQSTVHLEKLLLVLLCSPSNEIVSTAIACFGYLVDEIEMTASLEEVELDIKRRSANLASKEEKRGSKLSIAQNLEVYKELRTLIGGVGLIASSRAMQRRVRTVLLKMERASMGCLAAWEEVYSRWKTLFRPILFGTSVGTGINAQDRGERQNYTAFLCAIGGVCHTASIAITKHTAQLEFAQGVPINMTKEAEIIDQSTSKLPADVQTAYSSAKRNVGEFIADLQQLMVCDNDVVREFVKNFLGTELNSGLFGTLFSSCQANVTKFLGDEINNHERNIFFVESFISVLKLILERQYSENDQIEFHTMTGGVNFGSLIYSFVQYLNNVQWGQMQSTFIRIRTKVCQLVEIVITKKDVVALRQEIEFKNSMLNFVLGWNAELHASLDDGKLVVGADEGSRRDESRRLANTELKLTRDLDLASMRALVAILDGLPIQLTNET
ncbi:UNVERIFIED_CONTAM: Ras GTPase activating protein ira2, partial [Siphonaria sp. JEL0065]